jgi:hypothetical protein
MINFAAGFAVLADAKNSRTRQSEGHREAVCGYAILELHKLPCGPVAQLGARFHGMEEVDGSNPSRSTKLLKDLRPTLHLEVLCMAFNWSPHVISVSLTAQTTDR